MEFRDDQVVRYSRQILLREVGGAGQRALLGTAVVLHGEGPALAVARAYLVASGIAVASAGGPGPFGAPNPDACALAGRTLTVHLGAAPAPCAPGPAVWMGAEGTLTRLLVLPRGGCRGCAAQALHGRSSIPPGPRAMVAGAHAALAIQRWVLGWHGEGLSAWELTEQGETRPLALAGCPEHPR